MSKKYTVEEAINSLIAQGAEYKSEERAEFHIHGKTKQTYQRVLICDLSTGKFGTKSLGKIRFLQSQGVPVTVIKATAPGGPLA